MVSRCVTHPKVEREREKEKNKKEAVAKMEVFCNPAGTVETSPPTRDNIY